MKTRPNRDDYELARKWADLWNKAHPTQARHLATLLEEVDWAHAVRDEALSLLAAARVAQGLSADPLISARVLHQALTAGMREVPAGEPS